MNNYYVYCWAPGSEEWFPIKQFAENSGQLIVCFDSSEQLSYDQAESRRQDLAKRHPGYTFKVDLI